MEETYTTKDFYLSAYMIASGFPLVQHERHDGLSIFCFAKTSLLDELANRYYSFNASINPLTYASACKNLKGTMYNTTSTTPNNVNTSQQFRKG
jgi:hypothetical protein